VTNPVRRLTDSGPFRAFARTGPGKAMLNSGAFRRVNGARRRGAAERAAAADPARWTDVRTFTFFVGHMKSGTSLLGSLLDAHPDVILADEVDALRHLDQGYARDALFALLARGAEAEADKGRVTARRLDGGYSLAVPGGAQGATERPRVIGDGRAGPTTQRLADDPASLERLRGVLGPGIDLRVLHVIRDPLDPIALSVLRGGKTVAEATDHYVARCEALVRVRALFAPEELLVVRYEDLVAVPRARLTTICAFLGVEATDAYLDTATAIVRPDPEPARSKIDWPDGAIAEVRARTAAFAFLAPYRDQKEVRA
jgi:sulfotransferase family protein